MSDVTNYFMELGIDPFLAGLVIGAFLCALVRSRFRVSIETRRPMGRQEGVRSAIEPATLVTKSYSVTVSNKELGNEESAAMLAALDRGNKIEAIKIVREALGIELKQAKDLVEAIEKQRK